MLAEVAHSRGLEATSNRERGALPTLDENLYPLVAAEDWTFVTNNESDFRRIVAVEDLHAGLIVMPQGPRGAQRANFDRILDYIAEQAADEGEEAGLWMINRIVELQEDGVVSHYWLPQL